MLYINVIRKDGGIVSAEVVELPASPDDRSRTIECRCDWRTYEAASEVAAALGDKYQATDAGPYTSPRYDVIELPQVGDKVSYAFNGDSYPCGVIKSISKGPGFRRIVAGPDFTGADRVFTRRHQKGKPTGGAWVNEGTWSMVPGHVEKRNQEF